jgi:hypothetical protein
VFYVEQKQVCVYTLLIFNNPVTKRARLAAEGGITPRSGVGASEACAPGAEREKFSPLDLQHNREKLTLCNSQQKV